MEWYWHINPSVLAFSFFLFLFFRPYTTRLYEARSILLKIQRCKAVHHTFIRREIRQAGRTVRVDSPCGIMANVLVPSSRVSRAQPLTPRYVSFFYPPSVRFWNFAPLYTPILHSGLCLLIMTSLMYYTLPSSEVLHFCLETIQYNPHHLDEPPHFFSALMLSGDMYFG